MPFIQLPCEVVIENECIFCEFAADKVEYFQPWPDDALLAVSTHFLADVDLTGKERDACITMCQWFHTSTHNMSLEYFKRLGRHNYVIPASYLELINTFKDLLSKKRR
jgi:dynein heavy chain